MYVNIFFHAHSDVMICTEWLKSRITVNIHNERNIQAIDLIIFPMRRLSSFTVLFLVKVKEVKAL